MPRTAFEAAKNPKAFPLHFDTRGYFPDHATVQAEIQRLKAVDAVEEQFQGRYLANMPVKRFYRKHKAQFNDPICLYGVLTAMIFQQRGTYLRPDYLVSQMIKDYPLYHWDARTIGRIMSGIFIACAEDYTMANQPLDAPIGRGRDARSVYYVIDPHGGNEGFAWLLKARDKAMSLAYDLMKAEASGSFEFSLASESQPGDLYSMNWLKGSNVRTEEYYRAQWTDEPFYPANPMNRSEVSAHDPLA